MIEHPLLKHWVGGRVGGGMDEQVHGISETYVCLDCALMCGVHQNKVILILSLSLTLTHTLTLA